VADLPGVEKDDVSIQLMDPRTLQISCERKAEEGGKGGGLLCERTEVRVQLVGWSGSPRA